VTPIQEEPMSQKGGIIVGVQKKKKIKRRRL